MSRLAALPARLFLFPGNLVARLTNVPPGSDHEQILRMFANTAAWTLVGVLLVVSIV